MAALLHPVASSKERSLLQHKACRPVPPADLTQPSGLLSWGALPLWWALYKRDKRFPISCRVGKQQRHDKLSRKESMLSSKLRNSDESGLPRVEVCSKAAGHTDNLNAWQLELPHGSWRQRMQHSGKAAGSSVHTGSRDWRAWGSFQEIGSKLDVSGDALASM